MPKIEQAKGFTLLEVLISALLIMVGVGSLGVTAVSVRRFLKDADDKSRAMSLASTKMEEFLVKGYSSLPETSSTSGQEDSLSWKVNITTETARGTRTINPYNIPYRKAEVIVSYTADKGSEKNIRLTNIVPYPTVHSASVKLGVGSDATVPWGFSREAVVGPDNSGVSLILENIQYPVTTDIEAIYTVSVNVDDPDGEIQPTDTVYTACFFDGAQTGTVTGTPLRSQPSFSNMVVKEDVKKDTPHTIEIRWYYNKEKTNKIDLEYSSAEISLREAILTVVATEK